MTGKHPRGLAAGFVVSAMIALAAMTGSGAAGGAPKLDKPVLKFGYIDAFTIPAPLPQNKDSIEAYFDDWNKRGGADGHPVDLVYTAPGYNSGASIAAVDQFGAEGVIQVLDMGFCNVTKDPIGRLGIPAFGSSSPICNDPSFMANWRGVDSTLPALKWAIDKGSKHFGLLYPDIPGLREAFVDPMEQYLANNPDVTTKFSAYSMGAIPTAADIDGKIATMKADGVDTLLANFLPEGADLAMQSANRNGFGPKEGIKWIFPPNVYDPKVAANLPSLEGAYVLSQWTPWEDSKDPAVKKMIKVIGKKSNHDGFAASAYLAAAVLEDGVKKVKGDITPESLTKALLTKMHKYKLPLAPYKVDLADITKNPSGGQVLKDEGGKWVPDGAYIVIPPKDL
jgi:branched-chain amino acid transport system substrate-binding protein